jgi:hypothetical protein
MNWPLFKIGLWGERLPIPAWNIAWPIDLTKVRFFRDAVRIPNLSLLRESAQVLPGYPSFKNHAEDGYE